MMKFSLLGDDDGARRGQLVFGRGTVETPVFMPVATYGTVMALSPDDVSSLGYEMILSNTYHLHIRPGEDFIRQMGGLHNFIRWKKPILTDSGGFQTFSLEERTKITDEGVSFQSHLDGTREHLTPERVVDIQTALGSDIMMCLDHCPDYSEDFSAIKDATDRTTLWAKRSSDYRKENSENIKGVLFGIAQGGVFPELRKESADALLALGFDGYAIGGFGVGEPKEKMLEITSHSCAMLPADKPRYLMGVGTPQDIVEAVSLGVDMFDCVIPTRNARNGTLYTSKGKISLKSKDLKFSEDPPDLSCDCYTCKNFSLAYLRYIWKIKEISSLRLNTIHNLAFYNSLMRRIKSAIEEKRFNEWRKEFLMSPANSATNTRL